MSVRAVLAALLLLGVVCVATAYAQQKTGYVQRFENGSIDWSNGKVTAKGIGAPPANATNVAQARAMGLRAATVVARRNLLELLKGVQIDSTTDVQNYIVSNDAVSSSVRGFLKSAQVTDTGYMSDGSVEVTVGMNLRGRLSDELLPRNSGAMTVSGPLGPVDRANMYDEQPVKGYRPPKMPSRPALPENVQVASLGGAYTGLIINAQGLGVKPALSPRILDENGNEVYGSSKVDRQYAISQGMAGYAKSPASARNNPRVAPNPVVVKALRAAGRAGTDIIVDNESAELIRDLSKTQNFLEKCRVMIVL